MSNAANATGTDGRFIGIAMEHPGWNEKSYVSLTVSRNLKSGKVDVVRMTEDDLLRAIEEAARCLRLLRGTP